MINRRVLVRQGVYTVVKATSYSSVFYTNPALMITGAALEAGLVVYEAYEEADLWERYAKQLEKVNHAMDEQNIRRGGWVSGKIALQLELQGKALNNTVDGYHNLIKEKDNVSKMQLDLIRPMVGQNASQGQDNAKQSPLASLRSYRKRLAERFCRSAVKTLFPASRIV